MREVTIGQKQNRRRVRGIEIDASSPSGISTPEPLTRRELIVSTLTLLAASTLAACGDGRSNPSGESASVVMYISADDALARVVLAACTRDTGIEIVPVFDTEATKSTGLENRIRAERDRPRADLFWSSEAFAVLRLAADGLLAPLSEELWNGWPAQHRDAQRRWLAFSARARVLVWNTAHDTPAIDDLAALCMNATDATNATNATNATKLSSQHTASTDDAKRHSIAIADPRFGTTRGHLAALEDAWNAARQRGIIAPTLEQWLHAMRARGVRVLLGGNSAVVEAVALGECAYGLTDSDDAFAAQARGLPIAMSLARALPRGDAGGGAMVIPNTIARVARVVRADGDVGNDNNARLADRVAQWMVSARCEEIIARSPSRNLPLGPNVAREAAVDAAWAEPDPLQFDLAAASARADEVAVFAHQILTRSDS